jgi:hypothetical protein
MCAYNCVYIWQDGSIHSKNITLKKAIIKIQEYRNENELTVMAVLGLSYD